MLLWGVLKEGDLEIQITTWHKEASFVRAHYF